MVQNLRSTFTFSNFYVFHFTLVSMPIVAPRTKSDPQKMSQRMSQLGDIHPVIQWITEVKPRDASASLNFISGVLDYSCEQKTQFSFSEHLSHDLPDLSRYQRKCLIRKSHLHDKLLTLIIIFLRYKTVLNNEIPRVLHICILHMTHSQMFQKVKSDLPAKIWRLVGCTEMLSW